MRAFIVHTWDHKNTVVVIARNSEIAVDIAERYLGKEPAKEDVCEVEVVKQNLSWDRLTTVRL